MRPAQRVAVPGLLAAAISISTPVFAEENTLLDDIYFNASAVSGRAETTNVTGGGVSIGLSLPKNLFVQGDYQYLDLTEGLDNASVIKGIAGVQHGVNDSMTMYFGGGGYYAESEGNDDNGDGVVLTAGMTWGTPRLSALLHVDYLNSTGDGSSELYVVGIGVRLQLGDKPQVTQQYRENPSSMEKTTACQNDYGELFPFCQENAE
jgi:hypothetical protein